jgi:co-chaperonin GroES (HSP10)
MAKLKDETDGGRTSLARENNGLPPLDLMEMQGVSIPLSFEIENVLGDILMCELADENDQGEVNRGGIWLKQDISGKMWRVAKVIKTGPDCTKNVKAGDFVMYPSDKGIPMVKLGKKYVFLNEQRLFCTCKPLLPV